VRALYDVNVLLALFDAEHSLHDHALAFHRGQAQSGWATCAITENGFLRIISQSAYTNPIPVPVATERLRQAKSTADVAFYSCKQSITDPAKIKSDRILGPKMLTDVYLLALAVANDMAFVTFDRRVSLEAVVGAKPEHLVVL
jgi:uncharacterized protein